MSRNLPQNSHHTYRLLVVMRNHLMPMLKRSEGRLRIAVRNPRLTQQSLRRSATLT